MAEGPKREMKHPGGSWLHWPGAGNPLNDLDAPCRYPEVSSPFLNGILPKVGCHQIRKSISSAHGFSLLASGVGASGFRVEQMGDGEKPVPSAVPWNVSSSNKGKVDGCLCCSCIPAPRHQRVSQMLLLLQGSDVVGPLDAGSEREALHTYCVGEAVRVGV